MKEIFALKRDELLRIAVKKNGELVECFVEEDSIEPQIGEIYKGRIKNILPSINSIFIDIGLKQEAYMYYSEELKSLNLKKGHEMLVEVAKEPLGNKGAKVTHKVSIPGRYVVLTIGGEGISVSKRITKYEDRQRLLNLMKPVKNVEIVFRTESNEAHEDKLVQELNNLIDKKTSLERKLNYSSRLGKIDNNSISKKFFEELDDTKTKIVTDDDELLKNITEWTKNKENIVIEYYNNSRSIFDFYGIEKEILKLRHKRVNLPCGGYIVIDKTEAMYVIDVNSGKNTKARDFNRTILQTNKEAAKEIGRQIKLRNLSGIIIVDFIDIRDENQKPIIIGELKKSLSEDKGNVRIFPFTELHLVQISRKRRGKSIYEYLEEPCKKCKSNGFLLKLSYIENLIRNEIIKSSEDNSIRDFYIELDKNYEDDVKGDLFSFIKNIDGLDKEIYLKFVDNIEGYNVEPVIFSTQKENYQIYKIKTIEKV